MPNGTRNISEIENFFASDLCLLRGYSVSKLIDWLRQNGIPIFRGADFPKNPLDFEVSGRHYNIAAERESVSIEEAFKDIDLEVLLNDQK